MPRSYNVMPTHVFAPFEKENVMYKLISCAALGIVTAGVTLVTPEQSQAQSRFSIRFGNFGFSSGGGHYGYGHRSQYGYSPRYSTFGNSYYRSPSYGSYRSYGSSFYGGHGHYRQPTIVHPETYHWTPRRGLHTHGHMHVPHGNHYHTVPY